MAELLQPTSAQIRDIIGLPETLIKLGPIHSIIETSSILDLGPTGDIFLSLDQPNDKILARKDFDVLGNVIQFTERALPANPPANQGKLYVRDVAAVTTLFFLDSGGTETDLLAGGAGESNTISTTGAGNDISATPSKVGVDLRVKSLSVTAPIALTDAANDLGLSLNALVNADISASAAIAYSKLATLTSGNILVGSATNVATSVNPTGDIDISNTGVFSINAGVIVNADISGTAAIQLSKLENLTSARLIVGSATNVPTARDITGDVTISNTGITTIGANSVDDGKIAAHTSTKITITTKGQLNSNIVYTDQVNTFGDFIQTFKDNSIHIENPAGTFDVILQTSAEVTSDRILTIPLLGANRTMVVIGLANQLTNTELTAGAFVKITGVGTLTSGTWNATTIAIADGGTGQITQQAAINALTNVAAATNEHVLTKDTGTGDAIFKVATGGTQTPWLTDIDADGFDLNDLSNLEFRDPSASVPAATVNAIYVQASGMIFNTVTGNAFEWSINDVNEMVLNATELNLQNNKLANVNPTTITDFTTVTAAAGDFIWIIDAGDGLSKKVDANDFLGGASQTPWTSNIDAADFSLNNLDKLEFNNNVDTPVITQAEIYFNTATTGMNFNVPTGDEFTYRINGTIEMTVNATELDLLTLNIVNAGTLNTHTIPGGTDTFALLAASQVFTNKDILSNNNRVDIGTFEIASEAEGDVIFRNATVWTRLPRGTDNQALVATATTINYESLTLGTHVTGASTDLTDTAVIVRTNQVNTFGDFVQTFKDNSIHIENPAGTFDVVLQTSAEVTSDRILTIPLLGANRTIVVTGLTSQITIGTEVTGAITDLSDVTAKTGTGTTVVFDTSPAIVTPTIASFVNATHDHQAAAGGGTLLSTSALSDTADIAYLNTANTFIAGNKNTFAHDATNAGIAVLPIAGNPSSQVDGDVWLNVSTQQLFARINGANVDLSASGGEVITWTQDHSAAGFDLNNLSLLVFQSSTDVAPAGTVRTIYYDDAQGMLFNALTGDFFQWEVNAVAEMQLSGSQLNLFTNLLLFSNDGHFLRPQANAFEIEAGASADRLQLRTGGSNRMTINNVDAIFSVPIVVDAGLNITLQASGALGLVTMGELTTPATPATDTGSFYVKDVGTVSTAFFIGDDGVEKNITTGVGDDLGDHTATTDLLMVANAINFNTDGHTITPSATAFTFNASLATDTINLQTGAVNRLIMDSTSIRASVDINLQGNDLLLNDGQSIEWAGVSDRRITDNTSQMLFEVSATDTFLWRIGGSNTFQVTNIGVLTKNFIEFNGGGQQHRLTPSATNLTIKTGVSTDTLTLATGGGARMTIGINSIELTNRFQLDKGADLASVAGLVLGLDGNVFDITGVTTINTILALDWQAGSVIHLQFDGAPLITHNSGGTNDILLGNQANFQTAAGDVLTLFLNTELDWVEISRSVVGAGGETFTWTADHDAAGFDLNSLSNLVFQSTASAPAAGTRAIHYEDTTGMVFNALTGDVYNFMINDVVELQIATDGDLQLQQNAIDWNTDGHSITPNATELVINVSVSGDDILLNTGGLNRVRVESGRVLFSSDINLSGRIIFSSSTISIANISSDLVYDVTTSFNHLWRESDVNQMTLSTTSLDLVGTAKNITMIGSGAVGFIQMAEITDPAAGTASGKFYVKDVGGISRPFYIGEGLAATDLSAGGETFTWTANHDANGNALEDARFADDTDNTKIIDLNLSGMTTGIVLTLLTAQTTAQTITIPNTTGADDFVLEDFVQTLTGKTITMAGTLTMVNNTINLGTGVLQFQDANTSIQGVTNALQYDVVITTGTHDFRINNAIEFQIASDGDLQLQQNSIDFNTDGHRITPSATSLVINASVSTDTIDLQTGGASRLLVNGTTDITLAVDLNLVANEINVTSGALGDVFKHTATGFARFARGSAYSFLAVNPAGSDIAYTQTGIPLGSMSAAGGLLPASGGATKVLNVAGTNHTYAVLDFADAVTEEVFYDFIIPQGIPDNGTITVIIRWKATTATTGDVRLGVSITGVNGTENWHGVTLGAESLGTFATAGANTTITESTISISTAGISPLDNCILRIRRIGGDGADSMTDTMRFIMASLEWVV